MKFCELQRGHEILPSQYLTRTRVVAYAETTDTGKYNQRGKHITKNTINMEFDTDGISNVSYPENPLLLHSPYAIQIKSEKSELDPPKRWSE